MSGSEVGAFLSGIGFCLFMQVMWLTFVSKR